MKESTHIVAGLFQSNGFRSHCLMRDLVSELGEVEFFVIWDKYLEGNSPDFKMFENLHQIDKNDVIDFASESFGVSKGRVIKECENYKLLLRICLLLYLRKVVQVDYCLFIDDDVFIFEHIDEIVELSSTKTPFLIQEMNSADVFAEIGRFITRDLKKCIRYKIPNKGRGYNVGFSGLDLAPFDAIEAQNFSLLLDSLEKVPDWAKDQGFIVLMMFASGNRVHTFDSEKYLFSNYDDPTYRSNSKVYHCIGTTDKTIVDLYYKERHGMGINKWFAKFALAYFLFPRSAKRYMQVIKGALRIRTRLRNILGRSEALMPVLNANRYKSILNYIGENSCGRILEIGVWRGDTAEILILNSKNRDVEYHGIDIFEDGDEELLSREKQLTMRPNNMAVVKDRLERISKRVFLHKGFSINVYTEMSEVGLKFDLIWIDGGHSYDTVKFDFENYSKLLTEDGIIFFDDYTEDPNLPDVKEYIDREILNQDGLDVKVCEEDTDHYRGYDYKVVSVRFKKHEAREASSPMPLLPVGPY